MQNRIFNDYHVVHISRSSFSRVSSAVWLFCIISSALGTDGNIRCYSLDPSTVVSTVEYDFEGGG